MEIKQLLEAAEKALNDCAWAMLAERSKGFTGADGVEATRIAYMVQDLRHRLELQCSIPRWGG